MINLRQLHTSLAPIMVLPLLLTLMTGVLFQIAELTENSNDYIWLLEWHTGKFGAIDLHKIYPFLNAAGLFTMIISGITMWFKRRPRRQR